MSTPLERRAEADRLLQIIRDANVSSADMNDRDAGFFEKMEDPAENVSVKQLYWLRDIKDRYCL